MLVEYHFNKPVRKKYNIMEDIKLTQYSHGAGCGCKIAPGVLAEILDKANHQIVFPGLIVGNDTNDDAAVFDIGDGKVVISTTDFFMPIVDNPEEFGAIASVNAISDIYAMGGTPIMAIAILGWPVNTIPVEVAGRVLNGAREACGRAGIPLAGGHSIDSPEPIFGLAVTGIADKTHIKYNNKAKVGDYLFLTKKLGVGIVSTAQKKNLAQQEHLDIAKFSMLTLNDIGRHLAKLPYVHALTDVTGFGLLGHLVEMCEGSDLSVEVVFEHVPRFDFLDGYLDQKCVPGGTHRNWDSYGHKIGPLSGIQKFILADPQTSGGLLIAVDEAGLESFNEEMRLHHGTTLTPLGRMIGKSEHLIIVR